MKMPAALLVVFLAAGCSQSSTETGAPVPEGQARTASGAGTPAPAYPTDAEKPSTAMAMGTVESIDTEAGRTMIAHGPVEALDWPAMTRAFKATPEQVASVQAGQTVKFEFEYTSAQGTIIRIAPK